MIKPTVYTAARSVIEAVQTHGASEPVRKAVAALSAACKRQAKRTQGMTGGGRPRKVSDEEIVRLRAVGMSSTEIGKTLGITPRTVDRRLANS